MRVLIIDDHAFVCAGLKTTLQREMPGVEVFTANDADSALQLLSAHQIELVIADLFMPGGGGGFGFIGMLCESYPQLPVIILSASENVTHVKKCLDLGVSGFVPKSAPSETLFDAISVVIAGECFVPEVVREPVSDTAQIFEDVELGVDLEVLADMLTRRQMEILQLITNGNSNKVIAKALNLSENTVKVHVSAILKALKLKNRTQIGLLGQRLGVGFS